MIPAICILVFIYWIGGKASKALSKKMSATVVGRSRSQGLKDRLRPFARKAGRATTRSLLQFYYVLTDKKSSLMDRILTYTAINYTISPAEPFPRSFFGLIGIFDKVKASAFVHNKIRDKITPKINMLVDQTLNDWFEEEFIDRNIITF